MTVRSPFPDHAWPRVWTWIQSFRARVCDDFAPKTLDEFVEQSIERAKRERTWGVYRDDELGGLITFHQINPVTGVSHVLFKRSFWGEATTIPAITAVYRELFAAGVRKISSAVFADNHAILSLARKIGAREEGLLRQHTQRDGRMVDMVALGLLKEDFDAIFGADGDLASGSDHGGGLGSERSAGGTIAKANDYLSRPVHTGTAGTPEKSRGADPESA